MRTIKASEVVKGMRVRFEASNGDATIITEGVVTKATGAYIAALFFGDYGINLNPDHPVTVLAEPEPEWVEGAWYWTRHRGGGEKLTVRKRGKCGWVTAGQAEAATYLVPDEAIEAFGRVLIVDWPGDDVAEVIEADNPPRTEPTDMTADDYAAQIVADAIRTQGGAR